MKIQKLFTLAVSVLALNAAAQTADDFVNAGRTNLPNNLPAAFANFNLALGLNPNHADANVLAAATRLLLVPRNPAVSNFFNRIGLTNVNGNLLNIFNHQADFKRDANDDIVLPSNLNSTEAINVFSNSVIPAIHASVTNLSRISNANYQLNLTADETGTEAVTLDYGDILLLQALLYAGDFAGHSLDAHNFGVVIPHLLDLGNAGQLTIQRILSDNPSLLTPVSAGERLASRASMTNGIAVYLAASDFIRNVRPAGAQRLFELDSNDVDREANFREFLAKVPDTLVMPVNFDPSLDFSIYTGGYFPANYSLRALLPQFFADRYIPNSLPDYTLGGLIVGATKCEVEQFLRHTLDHPEAGIYIGDLYDSQFGHNFPNAFAVLLGTNLQAKIVGFDNDVEDVSLFFQFPVQSGGDWSFETSVPSNSGTITVDASGSFNDNGSFYGELNYFDSSQNFLGSQTLNGNLWSSYGNFQGAAGFYTGSFSGGGSSGKLQAILSADGQIYFAAINSNGQGGGGGQGQLDGTGHFTTTSGGGTTVTGTLNPTARTFSGTFSDSGGSGAWSLSRSTAVAFDVAPRITSPLADKIAPLGTNVTFSLSVTGSPPLCFQWYSNGVPISNAISASLVLSNITYASAASYSVTVGNLISDTNASANLTVVPETVKPTIAVTNPIAGQRVSNAVFTVKGKANDNVAVSNVWYQLNSTGWNPATTTNGWTNWTADVVLMAGSNVFEAYAIDTSANLSTTSRVSFIYVLSAPLIVQIIGSGTVTPNLNGAMLEIGKTFSMTARAATGSGFTGWTGSLPTNTATIRFVMASNLTLIANFADITKPVLTITAPKPNQRWSNFVFTAAGTAKDNVAVSNVLFQLNNDTWSNAVSLNNWSNWTAGLNLSPGTNVLRAFAVDTTGNTSLTNTVRLDYVVTALLLVQTNGKGTITPNLNGQLLEIGRNYSMTAKAGTGFAFFNWTGNALTNKPGLIFMMASNLTFIANFVDVTRPVLIITNPVANQRWSNVVFVASGKASDNVGVSNVLYQVDDSGWNLATIAPNGTNWSTANWTLFSGSNIVQAFAMDAAGNNSLTNSIKFVYVVLPVADWAPDSLNGLAALVTPDSGAPLTVGFDPGNFSQMGTTTNNDDFGVGVYTYNKLGTNSAELTLTITAPPSETNNSSDIALLFTNHYSGTFSNTDGHTGSLSFFIATNVVPAALTGRTLFATNNGSIKADAVKFVNGSNFTHTGSVTNSGIYSFARFSPISGILFLTITNGTDSGNSVFIQLTFASTSTGGFILNSYDGGGNLVDTGLGRFKIQ